MDNIIPFIIHHWFLVALFVVLLLALLVEEVRTQGAAGGLTPRELTQAINHDGAIVIDIRDKDAYVRGHITGAINIPASDIEQNLNKLNKQKRKKLW